MKPIKLQLNAEQLAAVADVYRQTKEARIRTRAQVILLNAEQGMVSSAISSIVRLEEVTVQRILHRFESRGLQGLKDEPRSGRPRKMTEAYLHQLLQTVRRRPRALGLEFSLWTLDNLRAYMNTQTGLMLARETIRRHLKENGFTFSRPQHTISSPDPDYEVKKKRLSKHGTK